MTPHNEANIEDIAETVLMPGDPLRAKHLAENFLKKPKLINSIRNMNAYTGYYKNKKITVFPSGMGMPSIGIYSYELLNFYNVQNIIRIGSCGSLHPNIKLLDTILVNKSYTTDNYYTSLTGKESHILDSNSLINNIIKEKASILNYKIVEGNILCSDLFDKYCDFEQLKASLPKELNLIATEMESFSLFSIAKLLGKNASCLLTVVDSHYTSQIISPKERENSLNDMITLALEAAIDL